MPWPEKTNAWHRCPDHPWTHLQFCLIHNAYLERPLFFVPKTGQIVRRCPTCGITLNLNDCMQLAELINAGWRLTPHLGCLGYNLDEPEAS